MRLAEVVGDAVLYVVADGVFDGFANRVLDRFVEGFRDVFSDLVRVVLVGVFDEAVLADLVGIALLFGKFGGWLDEVFRVAA